MTSTVRLRIEREQGAVAKSRGQLAALSPFAVLNRGYALATDAAGSVIRDATQVSVGDEVHIRLNRGSVTTRAEQIKNEDK